MKTVNINGIEYVQKKELDELKSKMDKEIVTKNDLEKIKAKVLQSFEDLNQAPVPTPQRSRGSRKVIFKPSRTAQIKIHINGVKEDGHFILKKGYSSKYTLKDVRFLKAHISKKTTHEDIRNLSEVLGLRREMVRKLIYNINEGTFDDYL